MRMITKTLCPSVHLLRPLCQNLEPTVGQQSRKLLLTWRVSGREHLQGGSGMDGQQSSAHIQSLSLQDGAHLDVQLVAVVAAVTPQDAQEPEERQRLRQVDL